MVLPKQQAGQLELFKKRIPKRPYHTNTLSSGIRIAEAIKALESKYIQPNGPTHRYWIVFDLDRCDATMHWDDVNAPPPNITATNPDNGHAHLFYGLEVSVRIAPDGKSAPLRYAAAIESALRELLGADAGYSGLISKNPLHNDWLVQVWETHSYDLDWLADYLDLSGFSDRRKKLPDYGLGRNCNLFEKLSRWAYRAIRQGWPDYDQWMRAVRDRATGYNKQDFSVPLPDNEVGHTAKSVGKWVYQHFSPEGFREWQAAQGKKGGLITASRHDMAERGAAGGLAGKGKSKAKAGTKGGAAKGKAKREALLPAVLEMHQAGFTNADIARELGESKMTVGRWVKQFAMKKK